ncbi:MAG: hypothetical protein DME21_01970 [Verrucomicrobia bacterium]|nr:MAG: hypothetical protein DME21_01970 [Verrucomicrobiota bacterium]
MTTEMRFKQSIFTDASVAVKIKGGRAWTKPGEIRSVPQRQKSKGSVIATAALELSTNQITHFYSEKKNTDEMIRMLELLVGHIAVKIASSSHGMQPPGMGRRSFFSAWIKLTNRLTSRSLELLLLNWPHCHHAPSS